MFGSQREQVAGSEFVSGEVWPSFISSLSCLAHLNVWHANQATHIDLQMPGFVCCRRGIPAFKRRAQSSAEARGFATLIYLQLSLSDLPRRERDRLPRRGALIKERAEQARPVFFFFPFPFLIPPPPTRAVSQRSSHVRRIYRNKFGSVPSLGSKGQLELASTTS